MSYVVRFAPQNMSTGQYDEIMKRLAAAGADKPKGRLFHVAFGPPDALRVSDIWSSREEFETFGAVLMPILQDMGVDPGTPDWIEVHNVVPGQS